MLMLHFSDYEDLQLAFITGYIDRMIGEESMANIGWFKLVFGDTRILV